MVPAKDGRLLRPHPTSRAAMCEGTAARRNEFAPSPWALTALSAGVVLATEFGALGSKVAEHWYEVYKMDKMGVHDISLNHYTWLARRCARACVDARRFLEREEATRCCCCGCVLGGSSCPSPTLPTFGVRHELRT
ncbi:hypothetical protein VPH35_106785 [Triticum aestivum]